MPISSAYFLRLTALSPVNLPTLPITGEHERRGA